MNVPTQFPTASLRVALGGLLLGLLVGVSLSAAAPKDISGCGHDARLDQADANLEKAFALIVAAENEGVDPPFGNHDAVALQAIQFARRQVAKAALYAECSCE